MNPDPHPPAAPPEEPRPETRTTALSAEEEAGSHALNEALRSSARVVKVLMVLVGFVVLFSGVFTVEPNEVALVLRFGKPVGSGSSALLRPGLHFAFPYPIDEIVRLPAGLNHSVSSSIGWYAETPEQRAKGEGPEARGFLVPGVDGYLLAGDGAIFHARASMKYRIQDPIQYAFRFRNTTNVLQLILDNALLTAAAGYSAESAIYRDQRGFRDAVMGELSTAIESNGLGVSLDPVEIQVVVPADVRAAFEAVLAAEQERSQKINEAQGYANESVMKARGEAQAVVSAGASARQQLVLSVSSEARYFAEHLPHYHQDPVLFRTRRLAETMERVLANAQDVFLLPTARDGNPREVRIQLNREPQKSRPTESPTR